MTGTTWESRLLDLFDDLEQQAAGLHLADRDLEVDDLSAAEYAEVGLADRLRASRGQEVAVTLCGGLSPRGTLTRSAGEWLLLGEPHQRSGWLVPLDAVLAVSGLSARAAAPATASVTDRLSLRSLVRRVADEAGACQVHLRDGSRRDGRVRRVGRDFVELDAGTGSAVLPLPGIAAVRWAAS